MNKYNITLGKTYFNKPIFNVGGAAYQHFGNHDKIITIILQDHGY